VTLSIPKRRIIALVGNNGSGKSTLAKLLYGLYGPDTGRIRWGDVDVTEADRADLFDRIAIVAQDFYRWPFTARINIAIGRPEASLDEDLLHAAEYAGADETIASLPCGWDTLLARGYKGATRSPVRRPRPLPSYVSDPVRLVTPRQRHPDRAEVEHDAESEAELTADH
jgi:ATP-binding cassette subfamily B protein